MMMKNERAETRGNNGDIVARLNIHGKNACCVFGGIDLVLGIISS